VEFEAPGISFWLYQLYSNLKMVAMINKDQILKATWLDILFSGRNKLYGAYPLRKSYGNRLIASLAIAFAITGLLLWFACFAKHEALHSSLVVIPDSYPSLQPVFEKPVALKNPSPKSGRIKSLHSINRVEYVPATFVLNASSTDKEQHVISNLDGLMHPDRNISSAGMHIFSGDHRSGSFPGAGNGHSVSSDSSNRNDEEIAEIQPEFPGGKIALMRFLQQNLRMPDDLYPDRDVKITAHFIVASGGKIVSIVTDGDGDQFDNEVIRVLKKMPDWIPGKSSTGRDVSSMYTLPVVFHIDRE